MHLPATFVSQLFREPLLIVTAPGGGVGVPDEENPWTAVMLLGKFDIRAKSQRVNLYVAGACLVRDGAFKLGIYRWPILGWYLIAIRWVDCCNKKHVDLILCCRV